MPSRKRCPIFLVQKSLMRLSNIKVFHVNQIIKCYHQLFMVLKWTIASLTLMFTKTMRLVLPHRYENESVYSLRTTVNKDYLLYLLSFITVGLQNIMLVYCYLNVILVKIKVLFFFPSQIRMFSKIKNRTLIWIKFLKLEALLHLIEYF